MAKKKKKHPYQIHVTYGDGVLEVMGCHDEAQAKELYQGVLDTMDKELGGILSVKLIREEDGATLHVTNWPRMARSYLEVFR